MVTNSRLVQRVRHDARHAVHAIIPLVAVLFSACTSQKGTEWDALSTQMLGQFNSAHYDACLDTGAKALAVAKAENDPRQHDVISTLNLSAICHQNKRELAQARTLLERARDIVDKAGDDPQHDYAVRTYNNLATLAWAEGNLAQTEVLLKENVVRTEKFYGPNHETVAMTKGALGAFYGQAERYDDAQPLLEAAVASYENAYGKDPPGLVVHLGSLASLYMKQGKFADAEALFHRSLEIERKAGSYTDGSRALTLAALAELYVAKGDRANAEANYRSALDLAAKRYPDARFIATTNGDLAAVYAAEGKDAEAEPLFRKAIATEEKAAGADTVHLKKDLEGLASVCDRTGKGDEADALQRRVAALGTRIE
jgi:tetratricopeptide (TPR) repeat protein